MGSQRVKNLIIIFVVIVVISLLKLCGFGFGNEIKLSLLLGTGLFGSDQYLGVWFVFILFPVLGLLLPLFVVKFVFKEDAKEYGFGLGDTKTGMIWLLVLLPVSVIGSLAVTVLGVHTYYSYLTDENWLKAYYVALHCISYIGFVLGFEFLFRGFVLFGLAKNLGNDTNAKWIAVFFSGAASVVCLLGLPITFIVSALALFIPAGFLNFRLRSFLYIAMFHWSAGIWADIWEIIKNNILNS